jgi:hypothetical protein
MEAMLAPRIISTHHAAMECFRRAARPDTPDHMALRLHGKGMSLANLATRTQRGLRKCQAEPPAYPAPPLAEEAARPQPAPSVAVTAAPMPSETLAPAARADALHVPMPDDGGNGRSNAAGATALAA